MGRGVAWAALGPNFAGARFTLATLRGHAQFELNVVEAVTLPGGFGNGSVADAMANANDHGMGFEVETTCG